MASPSPLSRLAAAVGLGGREHVAIVGGGGKTTLVHALGRQLRGDVVLTCTTKMGADQHRGLPTLLSPSLAEVRAALGSGPVMVWRRVERQKAMGVDPGTCDQLFAAVDHVVIEADGSRQRPFKAPAVFEPVVPASVTVMLSVIGADALGRVIADRCHRPLRVAALAGVQPYARLSPAAAATVLLHERGARKELPAQARFATVVTKVGPRTAAAVDDLCGELAAREPGLPVVLIEEERV